MTERAWLACALCAIACGGSGDGKGQNDSAEDPAIVPSSPDDPFPEKLSAVGIYPRDLDVAQPTGRAFPYAPRSPLWSDGLFKDRLLVLPEGKTVNTKREPWRFPPGTLLVKTFSDLDGPIETRILRKTEQDFEYEVYRWNDKKTEARLLDGRLNIDVEARTEAGTVPHTIPSRLTCRQCHESNDTQVLGFNAMQLWDTDAGSELGSISSPEPKLTDPLPDGSATTHAVLDYFVGNCVHCHNGGVGLSSSFDLRPGVALDNVIDQPTQSNATAAGIRVVPGSPAQSILFQAVSGENAEPDVKDMPPEGVDVRDSEAIELLRRWIEQL
jgi:hypothetical protein